MLHKYRLLTRTVSHTMSTLQRRLTLSSPVCYWSNPDPARLPSQSPTRRGDDRYEESLQIEEGAAGCEEASISSRLSLFLIQEFPTPHHIEPGPEGQSLIKHLHPLTLSSFKFSTHRLDQLPSRKLNDLVRLTVIQGYRLYSTDCPPR